MDNATSFDHLKLLTKLGEGGMGQVHLAYDPTLDRNVAVKLLRYELTGSSVVEKLLREARSIASVEHPNIVTVHGVGVMEGRPCIQMEYVKGQTLTQWNERGQHSWREVLNIFKQVAQGIEAAHEKGILHRDLKLNNIMIDTKGQARVVDFGLAKMEATTGQTNDQSTLPKAPSAAKFGSSGMSNSSAFAGTPAYMSREQIMGRSIDSRADQFSFCVSFWLCLYGEHPFEGTSSTDFLTSISLGKRRTLTSTKKAPKWLRAVVERGLSSDPNERFPSMTELRKSLEAEPNSRRAWQIGIGGTLALSLGIAFATHQVRYKRAIRQCEHEASQVDEIWNDSFRAKLRQGLLGSGATFAEDSASRAMTLFDAYAIKLSEARYSICYSETIDQSLDPTLIAQAWSCLDERAMNFESIIEVFSAADSEDGLGVVQGVVLAAASLPSIELCQDTTHLTLRPRFLNSEEQRGEVDEIRGLLFEAGAYGRAGKYQDGFARSVEARRRAEVLGWGPLIAEAGVRHGTVLINLAKFSDAEAELESAYFFAGTNGDDETAALAARQLAHVVGRELNRYDEGLRWAKATEMALKRASVPRTDMRWSPLLTTLGGIHDTMGHTSEALSSFEESLAIDIRALGPEHPTLTGNLSSVGYIYAIKGDYDQAQRYFERAVDVIVNSLGPAHPNIANSLRNLGGVYLQKGQYDKAIETFARVLEIQEKVHGPKHPQVARTLHSLAGVYEATGDYETALDYASRALSIREHTFGLKHTEVAYSLDQIGGIRRKKGDYEQAIELFTRVLAIHQDTPSVGGRQIASALSELGSAYFEAGNHRRGTELWEQALAIDEQEDPESISTAISLCNLVVAYLRADRLSEATETGLRCMALERKIYGERHPTVAGSLVNVADVHIAAGRYDEAVTILERSVDILTASGGEPMVLAQARFTLARALWEQATDRMRATEIATSALESLRTIQQPRAQEMRVEMKQWLDSHK